MINSYALVADSICLEEDPILHLINIHFFSSLLVSLVEFSSLAEDINMVV